MESWVYLFKTINILPFNFVKGRENNSVERWGIFHALADKVFDNPRLLHLLDIKIKQWLKKEKTEFIYSLAGYIWYLKDNYIKAEKYFLKALCQCPYNLDNWLNLAFSLYHQGDRKHSLAKKILFRFDYCVNYFGKKKITIKELTDFLKAL